MNRRYEVDCLVVGAGFAGSVMARVLADAGLGVRVVERRPHVAGKAFDEGDAPGVLIHFYGPHISKRPFGKGCASRSTWETKRS